MLQELLGIVHRLGCVVPNDFQETSVTAFMLVRYVGPCIHVPPHLANRTVFVTRWRPFEIRGLFDAVTVSGTFWTKEMKTKPAQVGYSLSADRVPGYEG